MIRYFVRSLDGKTIDLHDAMANRVDILSGAEGTIELPHLKVHQEKYFATTDYDSDVDVAAPKKWLIVTPNSSVRAHCTISIASDTAALVEMYEGTTASDNGTLLTSRNADRNSIKSSTVSAYKDPTVTDDGTLIQADRVGTYNNRTRMGGNIRQATEFILKQNTKYLMKITVDADNAEVVCNIEWYES